MAGDTKAANTAVQDAINRGVVTVESTHKSLANLPFQVLEATRLLRGPARKVKRVHDRTIGALYALIRRTNQQAGTLASGLLEALDKRRRPRARASGC